MERKAPRDEILIFLQQMENGTATFSELQVHFRVSDQTLSLRLLALIGENQIEETIDHRHVAIGARVVKTYRIKT